MKLQYDAIYDDVAGCVIVPLHDKIYEVMSQYRIDDIRVNIELIGLKIQEDGEIIETDILKK